MSLRFCRHAAPRVADSRHDVRAGFHLRVGCSVLFIQVGIGALDRQFPAGRHGIPRVDGQVHERLQLLLTSGSNADKTMGCPGPRQAK